MVKIHIPVVKSDIRYGQRGDPKLCMMARAGKRRFRGRKVNVDAYYIEIDDVGRYPLSDKAREMIRLFDSVIKSNHKKVKPFIATIEVHENTAKELNKKVAKGVK
jgi:hypothetical protein